MAFEPTRSGDEGSAFESETTGRFLVTMEPGELGLRASEVFAGAGLRLGSTSDFGGFSKGFELSESEGILFPDLGIALLNSDPDQVQAMRDVVSKSAVLRVVEPERVVRAIGEVRVESSYLLGYRDAVDDLVDRLLGGRARSTSGLAGTVEDGL